MSLLLFFPSSAPPATFPPTVTTDSIASVGSASADVIGTVSSDGGDTITERGFVVSTAINPTTADTKFTVIGTTGEMEKLITGLDPQTTYHVRAFATNAQGTSYGQDLQFRTASDSVHKHYFYKVYDTDGYVETWSKEVISEPSFRSVINGGPGELIIELGRPFDNFGEDVDVRLNNRVECWCVDRENPNGILLYDGYISGYRPRVRGPQETVEVTVLGFVGQLQRMIVRDASGNTTLTYNSYDPANILKDVIDKLRTLGLRLRYTASSVELTNTVVSYSFNANTGKECLDKILELCPVGWYWRVDTNDIIHLHPKNEMADHTFTLGLNVENLETFRRIEDLVNRVLFVGGGSPALFRKYENTGSQETYGLYERKIVDQRVTVAATAETISQRIISNKKDPEIRSVYTIVDSNGPSGRGYDIELIKPGQTLRIRNLKTGVQNISLWDVMLWDTDVWDQTLATSAADIIQIVSIEYRPDSIVIEASSRLPEIAKRIEDVQRNLEVTQMLENPSAPS